MRPRHRQPKVHVSDQTASTARTSPKVATPSRELLVGGYVLDQSCLPVSGALIEIWQAGPDDEYDLSGFHLRGHQYAAEDGRWLFSTVRPVPYRPRARHIHLKVQRPDGRL